MTFFTNLVISLISILFLAMSLLGLNPPTEE